jgi:hypothetical protein
VLTAVECAFLRGGTRAAILVSQTAPGDDAYRAGGGRRRRPGHARWAIGRHRDVRRAATGLRERLVGSGLLAPTGHFAIARCALLAVPVAAAGATVGESLDLTTIISSAVAIVCAVSLWFAPRRTFAGGRALRAERRRYERVTLAGQAEPDAPALAMLVARHGRPALDVLFPPILPDRTEPERTGPERTEPEQEGPDQPEPDGPPADDSPLKPRKLIL